MFTFTEKQKWALEKFEALAEKLESRNKAAQQILRAKELVVVSVELLTDLFVTRRSFQAVRLRYVYCLSTIPFDQPAICLETNAFGHFQLFR